MARKLIQTQVLHINVESMGLDGYREIELRVRRYDTNRKVDRGGGYRGMYNQHDGHGQRQPYSAGVYGSRSGGYGADNAGNDRNIHEYNHEPTKNYTEYKEQNSGAQVVHDEFGRDDSW